MYSIKLENLIELAIIDGILSDKERDVLYRRAKEEGIDLDEFEIVVEGRLFEKKQELLSFNNEVPIQPNPIPEYDKKEQKIRRCPACNDILQLFTTNCSSCDYELDSGDVDSVAKNLLIQLSKIDKLKKNVGNSALLSAFSDSNSSGDLNINEKCELINKCIIPNTKFEILSFLSIAIPLVNKVEQKSRWELGLKQINPDEKLSIAWKKKCEQVLIQAQFSMQSDKKTLDKLMAFSKELGIK
jgi:hypothetical protein